MEQQLNILQNEKRIFEERINGLLADNNKCNGEKNGFLAENAKYKTIIQQLQYR